MEQFQITGYPVKSAVGDGQQEFRIRSDMQEHRQ